MLSGTPSLCRPLELYHQVDTLKPGLLGPDKVTFDMHYCSSNDGVCTRPWELNLLLQESVMLRRLKVDVLAQLPSKMRQLVPVAVSKQGREAFRVAGSPSSMCVPVLPSFVMGIVCA